VAEFLFFQLSPVIEPNVPCVSCYDRRSGWGGSCSGRMPRFSTMGRDADLLCLRRWRRRRCSFVSCFQWIVNKQRLLSLQRCHGWLVSVLVSAAVSAKPIPLVSARYRYRVLVSV